MENASLPDASDKSYPPFSSLSLAGHWLPVYEWSCRAGVFHEWLVLLDTAFLQESPYALGTILEELSSHPAMRVLESSSSGSTAAQILLNLAQAFVNHRNFPRDYRPAFRGHTAKKLLPKALRQLYFLALGVDVLPPPSSKHPDWLLHLRVWFYIHAIAQGLARNVQDNDLRSIAGHLRQACRDSEDWRTEFHKFYTPATALDTLDRWIEYKCQLSIADEETFRQLSPAQQSLIRTLNRVARGESNPDSSIPSPKTTHAISARPFRFWRPDTPEVETLDESTPESGDGLRAQRHTDDDGSNDVAGADVEGIPSYTHQRLKADSVLLFNAEEMAFLPWSWQKPSPFEGHALQGWIQHNLASAYDAEQFNGALAWIAVHTGRSLRRTLDIPLSSSVESDWTVNLTGKQLLRQPPTRLSSWTPRTEDEYRWVQPVAPCLAIPLPPEISTCLARFLRKWPAGACLGDFWETSWGQSAENWFIKHAPDPIARLTPGMLANLLPQRLYEETEHATFARIVSSHPRSGLPGACAYSNWSLQEVQAGLDQTGGANSDSRPPPPPIGAGSRLDPLQSLLDEAVATMAKHVVALRNGNDVDAFHNAYTAYLCMQLWAATGARPVRDSFESIFHFDFEEDFVFIDDKASGNLRQGRLVPLPRDLARYLQRVYPRHLRAVASALVARNPSLAAEIHNMADRNPSGTMPYLFFLHTSTDTGWESVSESSVDRLGILDCPLPFNLFRQRLPKQLHRLGCDAELVDALLGHAEATLATHGDQSPRVWQEDMVQVRPMLERAYADMHFRWLRGWDGSGIRSNPLEPAPSVMGTKILFGRQARENKRKNTQLAAIRDARIQIELACAGRELTALTPDEFDTLSKNLLLNPLGLPRPTGYFRYQYLMRQLERAWHEQGKRVRLKKRYVRLTEESPFTDAAPGALALYRTLHESLQGAASSFPASRTSKANCAPLAAVILAIESRIASARLLQDIMTGKNFRIVQYRREFHLEYARDLVSNDPDAPVARYATSAYVAALLDRVLDAKHSLKSDSTQIPAELHAASECLVAAGHWQAGGTLVSFIRSVCSVVDQVNAMSLPGIVAAFLAERLPSTSLPWREWVGLDKGRILRIDGAAEVDVPVEEGGLPARATGGTKSISNDSESASRLAREFFTGIRAALSPEESNLPTNIGTEGRVTITSEVKKTLLDYRSQVSSAALLLGQWAFSLIHRRKNARNYVVVDTVKRYLGAVSPAFQDVGAEVDIFALDEEGMTEFYRDVLETRAKERPGYVAGRLLDFHHWASTQGIADPDWSELPLTADRNVVCPGLITESDYLSALALLESRPNCTTREARGMAFILLLCYRFGLRAAEALGMTRNDWIESSEGIVVLVRHHRFRRLKTPVQSRRQVPLVFKLSARERRLIRHWMNEHRAIYGDDHQAPMFSIAGEQKEIMPLRETTAVIRDALKLVSGNTNTTLHHARHTALNRVACALLHIQPEPWRRLCNSDDPDAISRIILGGRQRTTRRIVWALRRYAGHGATNTLFRSYLHLMGDWAATLTVELRVKGNFRNLNHVIDLDSFETMPKPEMDLVNKMSPKVTRRPGSVHAIQVMRLLGRGLDTRDAADAVGVPLQWAKRLVEALRDVACRSKGRNDSQDTEAQMRAFLGRISESAWPRLRKFCQEREGVYSEGQGSITVVSPEEKLAILQKILGERRQLVMWEQEHFAFVRRLVDFFDIPASKYHVYHSLRSTKEILTLATSFGFNPVSPKSTNRGPAYQIDSILVNGNFQNQRCALVFQENGDYAIRNSIELTVALLAVSAGGLS